MIKKFKNIEGKIKNSSRDLESIRESMHILDPKIQYVKLKLIFIRSSRTKDNWIGRQVSEYYTDWSRGRNKDGKHRKDCKIYMEHGVKVWKIPRKEETENGLEIIIWRMIG